MCFLLFLSLFCVFLEFPSVKSSKIFTAHRTQRDTNFKHEKSRVCKFMSFIAAKKLVLQISPENELRLK